MLCPGKPVLETGKPNPGNKYSRSGTASHTLLQQSIDTSMPAAAFIGNEIVADGELFMVDVERAGYVQTAIDNIHRMAGPDALILTEQQVNYAEALGVPGNEAWGTADVLVAKDAELQVHDYKDGQGVVVEAEDNPQLMLYGVGGLAAVQGILGLFSQVRLVIHQPRIRSEPSEWVISVEDLLAWANTTARSAVCTRINAENLHGHKVHAGQQIAMSYWEETFLRPGEKQCKFCRAKAECGALRSTALTAVFGQAPADPDEFADLDVPGKEHIAPSTDAWLAAAMAKADLIDLWLTAVRAEVERRLLAGESVPGYKVVQGRKGNRQWSNAAEAEAMLKKMRLKVEEMYDLTLISPPTAEKLVKAEVIGPRQWKTVQGLIVQREGKPSVAPVTDPRPALVLTPAVDDFTDVSTEPSDFA